MAKLIIISIILSIILIIDSTQIPELKSIRNFKFGNRVKGDRLMETYADAIVYEWPMIITQYYYFNAPNNTIINYVELNVDRSVDSGVVEIDNNYAIGQQNIRLRISAVQSNWLRYQVQVYGSKATITKDFGLKFYLLLLCSIFLLTNCIHK